jgi:hypothetical protein
VDIIKGHRQTLEVRKTVGTLAHISVSVQSAVDSDRSPSDSDGIPTEFRRILVDILVLSDSVGIRPESDDSDRNPAESAGFRHSSRNAGEVSKHA